MAKSAVSAASAIPENSASPWVPLKVARLNLPGGPVSERTAEGWCLRGKIVARKLVGRWLVKVDAEGFPLEPSERAG